MAANSMGVEPRAGTTIFDFANQELMRTGLGAIWLGDDPTEPDERDGPILMLVELPPNLRGEAHFHKSDSVTVVIEGSIKISGRWFEPGSVRVQNAGQVYGPTLTGPEGFRGMLIFEKRSASADEYVKDDIRERMEPGLAKLRAWASRQISFPDELLAEVAPDDLEVSDATTA